MLRDELNTANRKNASQKPQDKIEIVDENLKAGFAQMPRPVLRAKGLSFRAKCIYNLLLDYAWQCDSCFPGQERLASDLDTSVDTIQRGLKELRGYKLIDWKQTGLNRPNIYYILKLSDCCFLHPDTDMNGKPQTCGIQKPHECGILIPQPSGTKNTKSKNTKINNTKSNLRKAYAFNTEKEGEGRQTPARSHIVPMTTGKSKDTKEATPAQQQTPTQKPTVKTQVSKHPTPVFIGKPLTQEEIDEKKKQGQNASGFTPRTGIIPASHWQELETKAAAYPTTNKRNGIHYHQTTKHAPDFIDALMEQFSTLLHDERESIPQNINRAAKLYRQSAVSEDAFIAFLHDSYTLTKRRQQITTRHSDGRVNKMPYFFTVLEDKLGRQARSLARL